MLLNNINYNDFQKVKAKTPHRTIKTFQKEGNVTNRSHVVSKYTNHDTSFEKDEVVSPIKHEMSFQRIIDKNNILGGKTGQNKLKTQRDQQVLQGQNSLKEWFCQSKGGSGQNTENSSNHLTTRFGQSKRPSTHMNMNEQNDLLKDVKIIQKVQKNGNRRVNFGYTNADPFSLESLTGDNKGNDPSQQYVQIQQHQLDLQSIKPK